MAPNEQSYDTKSQPAESVSLERLKVGDDKQWQSGRRLSVVVDVDEEGREASVDSWPLQGGDRSIVDMEQGKVYHPK